jgi:hypothetical protein
VADYRLMGPDLLFRGVAALEVVRNRTLLALNLALFCSASLYVCYPVHAVPYTPARHFAKGRNDPGFRASGEDPDGSSAAGRRSIRGGGPGDAGDGRAGGVSAGAGGGARLTDVAIPASHSQHWPK